MNDSVIGTCSICGGPVVVPSVYWSVIPPVARCQRCGAMPKKDYGPVIPMVPPGYPDGSGWYDSTWTTQPAYIQTWSSSSDGMGQAPY